MKPKNKIKRLRQKNPFMTMPEIASIVGVKKQYVHEVLTKAGLSTIIPSYRSGTYCKICNNNTKYKTSIKLKLKKSRKIILDYFYKK